MARSRGRPEDEKLHPGVWFLLLLWHTVKGIGTIVLSVALFVGVMAIAVMQGLASGPEETLVPNVVGMAVEEAETLAEDQGLELEISQRRYSETVEAGHIIKTRPTGGRTTRKGQKLRAVVSRGPRNVEVPPVVGRSVHRAREQIEKAHLSIGEIWYRASDETRDYVLSQDPAAEKKVGRNHPVNLVVSGGPDYGRVRVHGHTIVFLSVRIVVPDGSPLQRVEVKVYYPDSDHVHSFYHRVRRPGDVVDVEVYGPAGATLQVSVEEEVVLEKTL